MGDGDRSTGLLELLSWYGEMGVDAAVAQSPTAWLARGDRAPGQNRGETRRPLVAAAAPASAVPPATPPPERRFPSTVPDAAVMAARATARIVNARSPPRLHNPSAALSMRSSKSGSGCRGIVPTASVIRTMLCQQRKHNIVKGN